MKTRFISFVILSCLFNFAAAEIYQCKDANGRTAFSDSPCPKEALKGTTDAHKLWREMREFVKKGSDISVLMGPDVNAILKCQDASDAYNKKLDTLQTKLNKLSEKTHEKMYAAMAHLRECGECRASAPSYCAKASEKLMEETKVLVSFKG